MTNILYKINCHTNLHVGSGDSNYGIIDNLVQRDVLTEFPMINESSLKGSIKEFFVNEVKKEVKNQEEPKILTTKEAQKDRRIRQVFGNEEGQGDYRFYAAHLLLFPIRTNNKPYLLATCPKILKEFCDMAEVMGIEKGKLDEIRKLAQLDIKLNAPIVFGNTEVGTLIEYTDFKAVHSINSVPAILGNANEIVLMADIDFKKVCGENKLPVIARNHLEDGRSTNLWYEEIVPRKSVFYCFIGEAVNNDNPNFFSDNIKKPMQIGANASIGYGLVTFNKKTL